MTGILKVDTIQKNNGATPTAADLGINVNGTILQVKQTAYSTVDSTTSNTPVNTGCAVSITPSTNTNKILVILNMPTYHSSTGMNSFARITRNNGAANSSLVQDYYHPTGTGVSGNITITWLDSPSTTSQVTYTAQYGTYGGGTLSINKDYNGTNNGVTYLTVMEVAA